MHYFKFAAIIACLLLFSQKAFTQQDPVKRVILIGIEGVSAESFQYANTPVLDKLISQGVLSLKTRGVLPALKAPDWATILSGAYPEQHGVISNLWTLDNQVLEPSLKDADGYFTSIFTLIRKQKPKAVTGMFYDWPWLASFVNKSLLSKEQYIQGQVMITSVALNFIRKEKPLFTFVYYGLPGETGCVNSYTSTEYYQSITDIDTEIGKIVAGLQEEKMLQNTTLIIASDHGGVQYDCGSEIMPELEVPLIISGPGIKKSMILETPNDNANIAPTVARILGLKTPPEWTGKSVAEIFETKAPKQKASLYIPKPWCSLAEGSFPGPQQIELSTTRQGSDIYYTLDGSTPGVSSKKYTAPFTVSKNCTLKAVAVSGGFQSQVIARVYTFIQGIHSATIAGQPSAKFPGSGVSGLFDGLIGSASPSNKQWMGFEGDNFDITIDLGRVKPIKSLGIDVLQFPMSLIYIPASVEFYTSDDGKNFTLKNTIYPGETDTNEPDGPVMLSRDFTNLQTQYIRIKAINSGLVRAGQPGEGEKAWLFVSEVDIE